MKALIKKPLKFTFSAFIFGFSSLCWINTVLAEDCHADAAWVTHPSAPDELDVGDYLDNCDAMKYSWQLFLALTQDQDGKALFEHFAAESSAFPAQGQPIAWPGYSIRSGSAQRIKLIPHLRRGLVDISTDEILQAGAQAPLVDQNQRWVHYSSQFNMKSYDYVRACDLYKEDCFNSAGPRISFPANAMLLKSAWRVIETCQLPDSPNPCQPESTNGLYTTLADIDPFGPTIGAMTDVLVALVGIHIATKPVNHPEWVWATFEYAQNAPDCSTLGEAGTDAWFFYNPSCSGEFCATNVYCDPCSKQCGADIKYDAQCKQTPIPTQVCRYYSIDTMNPAGTVSQLNTSVAQMLGPKSVWSNYRLVGALYTKDGSTGGTDSGSPYLANLTMETYKQDDHRIGIPPNTGCFTCHSRVFTAIGTNNGGQGDFSHSFKNIQQKGRCSATLPSYCPSSNILNTQQ